MPDENLSLGTLFTGKVDDTFNNAIAQLDAALLRLKGNMQKLATGVKTGTGAVKGFTTATRQAAHATKGLTKQTKQVGKQIAGVRGAVERLKAAMKVTLAYGVAAAAIYKVVDAFRAGVAEMINYDQALRNLQAISGATEAQVSVMGDTIKDVARVTKFSTVEVAEGMVLLTQAGFSASEAMAAIKSVSMLATGTLSSFKVTTDLVTSSLRAFGLDAMEASRVADIMANAINRSKLTIDKLRISFNYIGAAAAQTGLSLEETAATMMLLANNGLRASTIGTGMRQVLARLVAPNRKLREEFERYNIALGDINPRIVGYSKAMRNLAPILWDVKTGTVNMTKAFSLFGLRGAQSVAVLAKSFQGTTTAFDEMLSKVYEVGAAEAMAGIQAEGLGLKIKNLADRLLLFAVAIGESGVTGALSMLLDLLKMIATAMEGLARTAFSNIVVSWMAWTVVIAASGKALQILIVLFQRFIYLKIAAYIEIVAAAFSLAMQYARAMAVEMYLLGTATALVEKGMIRLRAVMKTIWALFLTNPVMIVAIALGALAAATIWLTNRKKKLREEIEKEIEKHNAVVKSMQQYAKSFENLEKKMKAGDDVSDQYRATLLRLIKDHAELANEININTASYKQLEDALKGFELKNFEKEMKEQIRLIVKQEEHVKDLRLELSKYSSDTADLPILAESMHDTAEETGRAAGAFGKLNALYQTLIGSIAKYVHAGDITLDQAEKWIREFVALTGAADDFADVLINRLKPVLEALGKQDLKAGALDTTGIIEGYEFLYNTLTHREKGYYTNKRKAADNAFKKEEGDIRASRELGLKEIVDKEKDLRKLGEYEDKLRKYKMETEKMVGAVSAEIYGGMVDEVSEEITRLSVNEQAAYAKRLEMLTAFYATREGVYKEDIDKINKAYDEEIELEKQRINKKLKEEGKTDADITRMKESLKRKEISLNDDRTNDLLAREDQFVAEMGTRSWRLATLRADVADKGGKNIYEKRMAWEKKYYDEIAKLEGSDFGEVESKYESDLRKDQKWAAEGIRNAAKFEVDLNKIKEMYANLRTLHQQEAAIESIRVVKEEADRIAQIEHNKAKEIIDARRAAAAGDKDKLRDVASDERDIDMYYQQGKLKRQQTLYDTLEALLGEHHKIVKKEAAKLSAEQKATSAQGASDAIADQKDILEEQKEGWAEGLQNTQLYSDKWLQIMQEMYLAGALELHQFLGKMKQYHKYWMDEAEKQWKRGEISVEKYTEKIKTAFDSAAITKEEADRRMIASTGTWAEALNWGADRAMEKLQSWQELLMEIGETFASQFADEATSALWDFIDGTESAEQAFQNFARSMLRWISEMIIKLLIQKAIMMAMGMGGGAGYDMSGAGGSPMANFPGLQYHKGGIVGGPAPVRIVNPNVFANAKHYGKGGMIGSNEEAAILHKGEGVFTPEQMEAMGGTKVELTNINVTDPKVLAMLMASPMGKNAMFNFIGTNAPMVRRILGGR